MEQIKTLKPNLAFLDINMPNGTGFDLLKSLPKVNFEVVFVTAYDQYAIQAIKFSALDYLLKPVNITELRSCVERMHQKLQEKDQENNLRHFVENLEQKLSPTSKLAIPMRDGLLFVTLRSIIRLEADGSYTHIITDTGQKIVSTRYLKDYEDILPSLLFIRVHNSYIVNMDHVVYYQRGDGGIITMSDKSEIAVSKRRKRISSTG